jgi:16S rRNA (adenine1518-N6/adenine1519-N6)-dimethyltransferase
VKSLLKKYSIIPKKRAGQSFLVNHDIARKIVGQANLSQNDIVLEIGGGLGILTHWAAKQAKHIYVIEVDPKLVIALREILAGFDNISIIEGDALHVDLPDVKKVVSNLPYSISSPITFRLLDEVEFEVAVLMYQKEFAKRLAAEPGSTSYSRLSIEAQYRANVTEVMDIPAQMFYPVPKVDSTIVIMTLRDSGPFAKDPNIFHQLIRGIYSYPNKQLRTALRIWFKNLELEKTVADQILTKSKCVLSGTERLRNLPLKSLVQISDSLLELIEENQIPNLRRGDT